MSGLTIVVCTLNRADSIRRFVPGLQAAGAALGVPVGMLLVDDGSTDATAAVAEELGCRVIRHDANRGLSAARNTAILAVHTPWVLFCDDDLELPPGTLSALWARRDPDICLVPEVRALDGGLENAITRRRRRFDWKLITDPEPVDGEVAFPMGACFLVATETAKRAGGWDERLRLYYEDVSFGFALHRIGVPTRMVKGAHVIHHAHGGIHTPEHRRRVQEQVAEARWRFAMIESSNRIGILVTGAARASLEAARRRTFWPLRSFHRALQPLETRARSATGPWR
jgi:N-acetylglucosaminyl-diphospho-decaprenol L-rhamnosyltransferase